ncbi:hypothetical protein XK97_06195 [Obesumbacterium proteus]|nr:hypothetical protein XK97_06195 [Obesumbacterium proteus]
MKVYSPAFMRVCLGAEIKKIVCQREEWTFALEAMHSQSQYWKIQINDFYCTSNNILLKNKLHTLSLINNSMVQI